MGEKQKWPETLWIVRHGESAGNVARDEAEASGQAIIQIAERDADVPLSERGQRQAHAVGVWFGDLPREQRPTVVLVSPYVRAQQTAHSALKAAGLEIDGLDFVVDERLREKEFGVLDRLTQVGIAEKYPEQAEFRQHLGKFYHRPPGGESWCDVILRLRSVVDTLCREWRRERVLIVSHQVVVLCFRYLMESMTEEQILAIDRQEQIANCSVTSYEYDPMMGRGGGMALHLFNHVAPVAQAGETVTRNPDVPVAPK